MARELNKSQMIREYAKTNAGLGPTEIARNMSHGKFKISPALVSQVLKKKRKKRKYTRRESANGAGDQISLEAIMAAKKLADSLGGVAQAKAAVDVLAKVLG